MSCRCTGSTHDAAALDVYELPVRLKDGELKDRFWIAGDATYVSVHGLLTPWSKGALSGEDRIYAGSFNFYHSSNRIHVEQAFEGFIRRWELFWKPIQYHIDSVSLLKSAAMRLHNFCFDNDRQQQFVNKHAAQEEQTESESFRNWWDKATALRSTSFISRGTRRDLESNELFRALTRSLRERGITRPATR